ncbi:MAG: aminotransferase class I/II-fold pyridoxal phosphate-dependent enzyme [Bacteroidales bacterium]|jgi:methionine-gamma-lyase|nr:aminotransferase class I/II-fold pyridoxal phosphate-dependent enzyme [Bacteroidales bacterium]MCK9498560.1 aminotransferase class I/II-fold pyridoxal phosphate-dependent enzyme [Bacteroidales bacterium]MDY0314456.1 aminotransferase class I/II-fold pyridoxal phosphate-dependent enzyme [Bacteroidales bacterium]NLB85633.1 aminotransferase class I/II-fold pyridoxal phosphate-dependent enzyme [Bacteroidales bacterium]
MDTKNKGFNTKLIHAGDYEDAFGSAVPPIYQTSTFRFKSSKHGADCFAGRDPGYIYTRIGNPTINSLEEKLAQLENGYRGIALSSGMAAVTTVYIAFLAKDAHIISTDAVYGPSRAVLERDFSRFGVEYDFVDTSDISNIKKVIRPNTKLLYIETPTNPTIALTDIKSASELAHEHGIIVCVDNTFSSPYLQKPLDLGADISLHSITKFINGHADIVGGALIAKDEEVYKKLRQTMVYMGGNMDPHQAYMVNRGLKTLSLRMERSMESAQKIAEYLEKHPKVEWVKYPGLKSHPQHDLAKQQMKGFGAMISFGLKGGYQAGEKLMDNVHLAMLAVSLGGVETLIQHPASMTHAGLSKQAREAAGISDGLVRFAVGIEDCEDIIEDLENALAKA